jgi:predicted dehydrogenase
MDYPIAYVRWTAKRNIEAFLHLLQWKKLHLKPLISKTISFDKSLDEYPKILNDPSVIGAIFQYSSGENVNKIVINSVKPDSTGPIQIGYIGSGNFSKMILLPILKKNQIPIRTIYSSDGASAAILAKKYNIHESTSDPDRIFANEDINTVFIATRHNTHFMFAKKAIENKKHIFVEKPLVMNWEEFDELSQIIQDYPAVLMVGFNRRFSPLIQKLKRRLLHRTEPVAIEIMVNAGEIPPEHWVHDPEIGGTRIIGELCHFIDLARFIADASIENINAMSFKNHPVINYDKLTVSMNFSDGSIANINYLANGSKKFPKERVEVFYRNKIFQINNFKNLISYGDSLKIKLKKQDKGHEAEVREFIQCIRDGKSSPIPAHELLEVHAATLAINDVNNHFKTIYLPELMNSRIRKKHD